MQSTGGDLIATKLSPPEPPARYVARQRLVGRLTAALDERRALVLVSAPAGSGKSTLLAGWLDDLPSCDPSPGIAWLQVDESDADPARFWSYVAAALDRVVPDVLDGVRGALPGGVDAAVATVVNLVARAGDPVVLVLDDYHLIGNPDVHASVERLIEVRPPNLTLVVATRIDPPFRLGRLRVGGRMTEIRAAELRFGSEEAATLLGGRTDRLDAAAIGRLCERTEGWAAGLVLAGLSLDTAADADAFVASFTGDDQLIADYLGDELLDALDPADRRRLLDVAVLERMSGPLVDAVCGIDDGDAWLRGIAAGNQLVIALDRTGTWFRFHHLLRDLLRLEARRAEPDRIRSRHAAAGRWHRDAGNLEPAIEHLLAAGELLEAADLIADNATRLLNRGLVYTVNRYLDLLGDVAERHGGAAIVRGWVSFVTGRFAEAERWLGIAARLDVDGVDAGLISALSSMIHVAAGDVSGALAVGTGSIDPTEPTHPMVVGAVRVWAGRFDDARPHLARAAEMAASRPDHFTAAVTPTFEALAELELGNRARARTLAEAALAAATEFRIGEAAQMALAHSVVALTADEPAAAAAAARRGVELARRSPEHLMLSYALTAAGDVLCDQGDHDGPSLLAEARTIIARCPDPGVAGRALDRVEARHGRAARQPSTGELVEELTDRELAVLRFLPTELSQREIASQLYVSLNTVKTHSRAIYRKLGVAGRKPAVQAARDLGLL